MILHIFYDTKKIVIFKSHPSPIPALGRDTMKQGKDPSELEKVNR